MGNIGEIDWYIRRDGREYGPITLKELSIFLNAGHSRHSDSFRYQYRADSERNGCVSASGIHDFLQNLTVDAQLMNDVPSGNKSHSRRARLNSATTILLALFDEVFASFLKIRMLITSPEMFGHRWIVKGDYSSIRSALSFFTTCFSIAFVVLALTTKFSHYSGASEVRVLLTICLQLLLGTGVLYSLVRLFRSNVSFFSMASLILYFDGIYLILSVITHASMKLVRYAGSLDKFEKDIYANLFESCVADKSPLYWIIRGDLEFFINSETDSDNVNYIFEYNHIIIGLLCILIVGMVFRLYYKPHISIFLSCAIVTFITISEGYAYGEEKLTDHLAQQNSTCWRYAAEETARRYRPELVTPQLLVNLQREIRKMPVTDRRFVDIVFPNISLVKNDFLVRAMLPSYVIDSSDQRLVETAQRFAIATYCNDSSHFRLVRALNARLYWVLLDETGRTSKLVTIDNTNCQTQ